MENWRDLYTFWWAGKSSKAGALKSYKQLCTRQAEKSRMMLNDVQWKHAGASLPAGMIRQSRNSPDWTPLSGPRLPSDKSNFLARRLTIKCRMERAKPKINQSWKNRNIPTSNMPHSGYDSLGQYDLIPAPGLATPYQPCATATKLSHLSHPLHGGQARAARFRNSVANATKQWV